MLTESAEGEKRVAVTPEGAKVIRERGFEMAVQRGAGEAAGYPDGDYAQAGASLLDASSVYDSSDMLLKVLAPSEASAGDVGHIREGGAIISFLFPSSNPAVVERLCVRRVTSFAMELIPRITRAQTMDALSSMSTIAGYKGALLAANTLPKFFPMLMTAAGTLPPARALVIGAGVAGLQAIATCKRLGAIVEAFDVRQAVKEQVESLGARFVAMDLHMDDAEDASGYAKEVSGTSHVKELEMIASRLPKNDIVITTALIPGKRAPILITKEMVELMPRGSVIVDLAAPNGGNCEATVPGQIIKSNGVTVCGPTDLLSQMAHDSSRMYSKNIIEFLINVAPEGALNLNMEDEIIRETLVTHDGQVVHEPTRLKLTREGVK
ncbi:MAG: Re/Si-specific NAD(P)(+) transhydrogenase subunit alpha [Fimbriimonadaceae bacterium]